MVFVFLYDRMKSEKELSKFLGKEFTYIGSVKTSGQYLLFSPFVNANPYMCRASQLVEYAKMAKEITGSLYDVSVKGLARLDQIYDCPRTKNRELIGLSDGSEVFTYILNENGMSCTKHFHLQFIRTGDWNLPSYLL